MSDRDQPASEKVADHRHRVLRQGDDIREREWELFDFVFFKYEQFNPDCFVEYQVFPMPVLMVRQVLRWRVASVARKGCQGESD
jgi:hypothetical protein